MKSWLTAAPEVLPRIFDEVEIWSTTCDLQAHPFVWRKFPKIGRYWPVEAVVFRHQVRAAFKRMDMATRQYTLVQCTGEMLPECDVRYMQFWNRAYYRIAKERPGSIRVSLKDRVFGGLAALEERWCATYGRTGEWWCVSRGLKEEILRDAGPDARFKILPNAYDSERFDRGVRLAWREPMREHYRLDAETVVFVFCAMGHFERKGLMQAIEVVGRLRAGGRDVVLLVLGGSASSLQYYKARSEALAPAGVIFAGAVSPIEHHLSAAEALLFPSHFEAFALVEIEAAALGLRLYLTAHPGHEMILREGVNGRLLPWDVKGMVEVLDGEIVTRAVLQESMDVGEALDRGGFERRLEELYREAGAGVVAGV